MSPDNKPVRMKVKGWPALLLAAFLALAVLLSACTGDPTSSPPASAPTPEVEGNLVEYEIAVNLAECLTENDWDVEVDPQGGWGITSNMPDAQRPLYEADYQNCLKELGLDDFKITEETASDSYDNNVRVIECLEDNGFTVDPAPSRSSFITKTLEQPSALVWDPYALVPKDSVRDAVFACPQ